MTFTQILRTLIIGSSLTLSSLAFASDDFDTQLLSLQQQWAKVNYSLSDKEQTQGFEQLLEQAKELAAQNSDRAEPLVWLGIIQSSYAGAKGGIGALSLAKEAKKSLESALQINDSVLQGSAYTSLGTLYHKVPGWPLGFGDDDDAKELLEKAIALNPNGIDPNYFYGEFLFDEKDYEQAKQHLMTALSAPARADRPLADESRRAEIQQLLTKVEKKLSKKKS